MDDKKSAAIHNLINYISVMSGTKEIHQPQLNNYHHSVMSSCENERRWKEREFLRHIKETINATRNQAEKVRTNGVSCVLSIACL